MPEFHASQAKELMNNRDKYNSEIWYLQWKESLFVRIKKEALNGNNSICIESEEWFDNEYNKMYLIDKLRKMGYTMKASEDYMNIYW